MLSLFDVSSVSGEDGEPVKRINLWQCECRRHWIYHTTKIGALTLAAILPLTRATDTGP